MFPFHLFSYQPNVRTRIYALTYHSEIVFVRVMDYAHKLIIDNPSSVPAYKAIAHLQTLIDNGLKPDANFVNVPSYAAVMPYFRIQPLENLTHPIGMLYLPSTVSWFGMLALLWNAYFTSPRKYSPTGKLHTIITRCDNKTRGVEFLIRVSYFTFRDISTVRPINQRNSALLRMLE